MGEEKEKKKMRSFVQKFWKDESGQDLIEYTLLMAFVALASASIFVSAGTSISTIWGSTSTQLSNAATAAS
jgi:Flp pilus assembly pilin Flp